MLPIETTRQFSGLYHVLHGSISPLRGIGPEQLRIASLLERMHSGEVKELIVATNPTVEGEATAVYLSRLLASDGVAVFDALQNQQSPRMVANRRGRSVAEIISRREGQKGEQASAS